MRAAVRAGALLLLLLLALSLALPAGAALAEAEGPTPPAIPDDLPKVDVTSWEFMLANSYNSLGFEYEMPVYGNLYGQGLEPRIYDITKKMVDDALEQGVRIYFSAGYRNMDYLTTYYERAVAEYGGAAEASKHFLAPGCNEHQTGLAIDVTSNGNYQGSYFEFEETDVWDSPTYAWMLEHCAEYGFILRYPEGKEAWYGTPCRGHFHFRYVGVEAATYIMEHGLCLEEFLYMEDPHSLFVPGLNTYATF